MAAFYPLIFPDVSSPHLLVQERNTGLLESESQLKEERGDKIGLEDGKSKKAISHALVTNYGKFSIWYSESWLYSLLET